MSKLGEMLAKAKKASKYDDIPGVVDEVLHEKCPVCGRDMRKFKKCCGSPNGYKGCNCGYRVQL